MPTSHLLLEHAPNGYRQASRVFARYLAGPGLTPLGATRTLMPAPTARALRTTYGAEEIVSICEQAGVRGARSVDDKGALALLDARDLRHLPPRPATRHVEGELDWHLDRVGAPGAWALLGGPDDIEWGAVRVGHVDTGYTEHPAFGFGRDPWVLQSLGRTFFAAGNELDDPGPGGGIDPLLGQLDGHGTRTASTICGHASNAAGRPFYGIAPKVPLVPVRIANHVWINHAQRELAQAIDYLVEEARVSVISLSMGIAFATILRPLRRSLDHAYESGVIFVAAAGNHVQFVVAPARLSRTLAVAGTTRADKPWHSSSFGPQVDLSGPAQDVRRAQMQLRGTPGYADGGDGTSYATAMVAGAAALWLARHGDALETRYPEPWQRVEAFRTLVRETARLPDGWIANGGFGTGVLDASRLLRADLPAPASSPDTAA